MFVVMCLTLLVFIIVTVTTAPYQPVKTLLQDTCSEALQNARQVEYLLLKEIKELQNNLTEPDLESLKLKKTLDECTDNRVMAEARYVFITKEKKSCLSSYGETIEELKKVTELNKNLTLANSTCTGEKVKLNLTVTNLKDIIYELETENNTLEQDAKIKSVKIGAMRKRLIRMKKKIMVFKKQNKKLKDVRRKN